MLWESNCWMWWSRNLLHVTHRDEHFTFTFFPALLLVSVELSCDYSLRPNELVLSCEADRLPHTMNVTKERTFTTLGVIQEIEIETGRMGAM